MSRSDFFRRIFARAIPPSIPSGWSSRSPQYPANVFLCNMGGIVAQYPTDVEFHYPSKFLPPGRDLFGEVLKEAHARKIRVIGRFDLSKTEKPVYDAHPEWFFVRTNGQPHVFNGLYSACINGAYYREHGIKILTEALERYDGRRAVFQHVWKSVRRLRRKSDGAVSVRPMQGAI